MSTILPLIKEGKIENIKELIEDIVCKRRNCKVEESRSEEVYVLSLACNDEVLFDLRIGPRSTEFSILFSSKNKDVSMMLTDLLSEDRESISLIKSRFDVLRDHSLVVGISNVSKLIVVALRGTSTPSKAVLKVSGEGIEFVGDESYADILKQIASKLTS